MSKQVPKSTHHCMGWCTSYEDAFILKCLNYGDVLMPMCRPTNIHLLRYLIFFNEFKYLGRK
jgi:hypothetical protein